MKLNYYPVDAQGRLNFEELCLPNRSDLLGLAVNLTKNKADAEDLLQQTFQLALSGWDSFAAVENVELHARAWLFCILRNRFTSNYRRSKNKKRYQETMQTLILEGTFGKREDDEVQPLLEREYVEMNDEVSSAFASLPKTQREVMRRFADGDRYVDIAAALGILIGTVMSRLFRARKALASSLRDYARTEYGFCGAVSTVKEHRKRAAGSRNRNARERI